MIEQCSARWPDPLLANINGGPSRRLGAKTWKDTSGSPARPRRLQQRLRKRVRLTRASKRKTCQNAPQPGCAEDRFWLRRTAAPMAELVDASDSKSDSARSAGSIPARGTTNFHRNQMQESAKALFLFACSPDQAALRFGVARALSAAAIWRSSSPACVGQLLDPFAASHLLCREVTGGAWGCSKTEPFQHARKAPNDASRS